MGLEEATAAIVGSEALTCSNWRIHASTTHGRGRLTLPHPDVVLLAREGCDSAVAISSESVLTRYVPVIYRTVVAF